MAEGCTHTFTPDYDDVGEVAHESKGSDEGGDDRWRLDEETPGVTDGTWACPHDAVENHEKCIFHLPVADRPANRSATESFLRIVDSVGDRTDRRERRRSLQFVDAVFESFDVRGEVIGGDVNYYLDLSHAELRDAEMTDARFRQPVRLTCARFQGKAWLRQTAFDQHVGLRYAHFTHDVRFRGAIFHSHVHFKGVTFDAKAWFWYAVFERFAIFSAAEFRKYAYFRGVDFINYVRFSGAEFGGGATFELAEFGDDADFVGTRFSADHEFVGAEFDRTTNFSDVTVDGPIDLSETTFTELILTPTRTDGGAQYVDLSDSTVAAGELGQPTTGTLLYDVADATLGDVRFTGSESVIERVRFLATSYDGFEFENDDMDPETVGWQLHTVADESVLPDKNPYTTDRLRTTYLNAKNGAKASGNATAVGAFYYAEMGYRRRGAREATTQPLQNPFSLAAWVTGGRGLSRWVKHLSLLVTTGYGEYPSRVIASSIAVVLGFGATYLGVMQPRPTVEEAFLFSLQSFITFIVGPAPRETTRFVATLSTAEGFVGAFFVALFVFAFTRRLSR